MIVNGPLIRMLRTEAGMTTRELGAAAHVGHSTISRIERGLNKWGTSPFTVERIADHFGMQAGVLYSPPRIASLTR